ncbi:MAG: hypothetical protein ACTH0B_05365, partial [Senegalia sp. (in: firmicutes)]
EMKRVIVAYKEKIVMEKDLDTALSKIFGDLNREENEDGLVTDVEEGENGQAPEIDGIEEITKEANELFNKAKEASREGDWAKYGEYINELESVLNKLNQNLGIEEAESETEEQEQEQTEEQE